MHLASRNPLQADGPPGLIWWTEIQLSKRDVLDVLSLARNQFSSPDWKSFLLRSIGIEASMLDERAIDSYVLRMEPFVERNYNLVELGPRGTGKSHLFQQVSPYAHLISGGKATVARMFVNNATGQRCLFVSDDLPIPERAGVRILPRRDLADQSRKEAVLREMSRLMEGG